MPNESSVQSTPADVVMQIATGYGLSRCLHEAAELGVADAVEETPRSAAELAKATGTDAGALDRVLRLLVSGGIFESRNGKYGHTPGSRLLRSDHPQSLRPFVRMIGHPIHWACYGELQYSIRTGLPASAKVTPQGLWKYYAEHPELTQVFDQAMTGKAQGQIPRVLGAYDFSGFSEIADIGGGRGHLLRAVLGKFPRAKGVLFDQPHVVKQYENDATDRLRFQGGNFFKDEMPVCDAYMMMDVIHDWNDEQSIRILKNLRRAAPAASKLLLIESIIPDDPRPSMAKELDIVMLALTGGKQRTQQEFAELLSGAGFKFKREVNAGNNLSIIEAVPK